MRITTQMIYTQFNYNLQNTMNNVYQTDEQIATGQKLNSLSDDPAAIADVISGKTELSSIAGYQDAITNANTLLNTTNNALDNLNKLISNAKTIGDNATSGTAQDMANYASLMGNIIQSVIGLANTEINGRYIFSGYGTSKPAVDATAGSPTYGTLTATATADGISAQINAGMSVNVNVTASGLIASGTAQDTNTVVGAMQSLQAAIQAGNQNGIQTALSALDTLSKSVLATQADVGIRLNMLSSEKGLLTSKDTDVTNNVSDKLMLSTTDIARLSALSQQQQTALSSLRSVTNGVLNQSLFDFLK